LLGRVRTASVAIEKCDKKLTQHL